jgi:hypothetical protein
VIAVGQRPALVLPVLMPIDAVEIERRAVEREAGLRVELEEAQAQRLRDGVDVCPPSATSTPSP